MTNPPAAPVEGRAARSRSHPRSRRSRRLTLATVLAAVAGLLSPAVELAPASAASTTGLLPAGARPAATATSGSRAVELGVRFRTTSVGRLRAIRFYKGRGNTGRHVVSLWTADGRLLARAVATRETSGGWQTVGFAVPVTIRPGTWYTASYSAPRGHYALTRGYFAVARARGPLRTPVKAGLSGRVGTAPSSASTSAYGIDVVVAPVAAAASVSSVASGHGPARGCLARPSRCGFPDASTTGYRHTGVRLSRYTGPMTITRAGTVIDAKLIVGRLTINADNVAVRRSKVVASGTAQQSAIRVVQGRRGARIVDVEVSGGGTGIAVELAGIGGIALRTDAYGSVDYFRGNQGSQVLSSYGHDFRHLPGAHSDGFQSLGDGDLVIKGNTLVLPGGEDVNSLVTIGGEYDTPTNVLIQGNLLNGGGFTVSLPEGAAGVRVLGNRFGRSFSYGIRRDAAADSTWAGNVWDDSGRTTD